MNSISSFAKHLAFSKLLIITFAFCSSLFAQDIIIEPDRIDFGAIPLGTYGEPSGHREVTISNNTEEYSELFINLPIQWENYELLVAPFPQVHETMRLIVNAIGSHIQDYGQEPESVVELIEQDYIELDENIADEWVFNLIGQQSVVQIEAVSTDRMVWGEGRHVVLDLSTHIYETDYHPSIMIPSQSSYPFTLAFKPDTVADYQGIFFVGEDTCFLSGSGEYAVALADLRESLNIGYTKIDSFGRAELVLRNTGHHTISVEFEFEDDDHFNVHCDYVDIVHSTLDAISRAVYWFHHDTGEHAASVEELVELAYVEIDSVTQSQWSFTLINSPATAIEAVSTAEMLRGAGHAIMLDVSTNRFIGFGFRWVHIAAGREARMIATFSPEEEGVVETELYVRAELWYLRHYEEEHTIRIRGEGVLDAGNDNPVPVPSHFTLSPAYPNPFNSSATIEYRVGANSNSPVTLYLYDLSGRLVQTLVEGRLTPGNYRTTVDANGLTAGMYFVRLSGDGQGLARPLQLVK